MMSSAPQEACATAPVPGGTDQAAPAADPAWDEMLAAGYGRRLWNVGCG